MIINNQNIAVVIPARLKSSRLANKPLIKINKIPMIIRTYNQCLKATISKNIFVLTDSVKIKSLCKKENINCVLTSKKCKTGTDRIAEFSKKFKRDFYINVQGDEPVIPPYDIVKVIRETIKNRDKIINGYTKIESKKEFFDLNMPKVVFDNNKNLIYMSRSPIPLNKKGVFKYGYRQVCIYGFPYSSLNIFKNNNNKTPLENVEDIEILRFLENGLDIKMIKLSNISIPVDTKKDLKKVKDYLNKHS